MGARTWTDHRSEPRLAGWPRRPRARRPGRVLRFLGRTMLLSGFILGAYILWLLWGTGFYTAGQQQDLRQEIAQRLDRTPTAEVPDPVPKGHAYAVLRIPRMDLDAVVVEGTELEALKKGPGHYEKTADPWERNGRVAIAGHRTTYGAWFWDMNKLQSGDPITLYTDRGPFHYRVTETRIVGPGAVDVLRKDPRATNPTLVLTTCHPRFSAAQRLIAFADQVPAPPDPVTAREQIPAITEGGGSPALAQAGAAMVWVGTGIGLLLAGVSALVLTRRRPGARHAEGSARHVARRRRWP